MDYTVRISKRQAIVMILVVAMVIGAAVTIFFLVNPVQAVYVTPTDIFTVTATITPDVPTSESLPGCPAGPTKYPWEYPYEYQKDCGSCIYTSTIASTATSEITNTPVPPTLNPTDHPTEWQETSTAYALSSTPQASLTPTITLTPTLDTTPHVFEITFENGEILPDGVTYDVANSTPYTPSIQNCTDWGMGNCGPLGGTKSMWMGGESEPKAERVNVHFSNAVSLANVYFYFGAQQNSIRGAIGLINGSSEWITDAGGFFNNWYLLSADPGVMVSSITFMAYGTSWNLGMVHLGFTYSGNPGGSTITPTPTVTPTGIPTLECTAGAPSIDYSFGLFGIENVRAWDQIPFEKHVTENDWSNAVADNRPLMASVVFTVGMADVWVTGMPGKVIGNGYVYIKGYDQQQNILFRCDKETNFLQCGTASGWSYEVTSTVEEMWHFYHDTYDQGVVRLEFGFYGPGDYLIDYVVGSGCAHGSNTYPASCLFPGEQHWDNPIIWIQPPYIKPEACQELFGGLTISTSGINTLFGTGYSPITVPAMMVCVKEVSLGYLTILGFEINYYQVLAFTFIVFVIRSLLGAS